MNKCVIIIDGGQPLGVCANIAAVLGASLGKRLPEAIGADTADGTGGLHTGIIKIPIPILKGEPKLLREILATVSQPEYKEIFAVDFTELAQSCRSYPEYTEKISCVHESELKYMGVALYGSKRLIEKIMVNLPLLR